MTLLSKHNMTMNDWKKMEEEEKSFERQLMDKYPQLFDKDENGNTLPSSCGIGGQPEWRGILDDLCGSIVEYIENTRISVKTKDKKKLFLYFLWKNLWCPVEKRLYKVLDPYRKYRPKDTKIWIIRPEVQKKVEGSRLDNARKVLYRFTYQVLCPKDVYTSAPPVKKVTIAQIKAKFGQLRFYVDGADTHIHGMIRFAEYLCDRETEKLKESNDKTKA